MKAYVLSYAPQMFCSDYPPSQIDFDQTIDKKEHNSNLPVPFSHQKLDIFNLPNEIIIKIFSYLDSVCLATIIKLVCKQWNTLASDSSLWKSISVEGLTNISYVVIAISECSQLQQLSFCDSNINSELFAICVKAPFLWSVSMRFCFINCNYAQFEAFAKNAKQLTTLDLEGSKVEAQILYSIMYLENLKYLNLSHCVCLENQTLVQILENCSYLEHLDIDGINFLGESAINSIFEIRSNTITTVLLDGEYLSDKAFLQLHQCLNLRKLSISFCESVSDATLIQFYKLHNLTFLTLRKGVSFTPHGIENLFRKGSFNNLTHLSLAECSSISDSSLIAIADCCQNLISLSLCWCWELTDISLIQVVKKCKKISVLDLIGVVRLEGHFLMHLKQGELKDLKILDLEQCSSIDDDKLLILATLRPSIKIFDFWGDIVKANTT